MLCGLKNANWSDRLEKAITCSDTGRSFGRTSGLGLISSGSGRSLGAVAPKRITSS